MSKGNSQKARILLEGREVPFVGASIRCVVGEPITATIDLVPLQVIKAILPKTQVQIFVQDSFNFGDTDFYLAFQGETIGRGMQKQHDGRTFQITVMDDSGYWDEAKMYSYNPNFLVGKIGAIAEGGTSPGVDTKSAGATTISTASTINSVMLGILSQALKGATTDLIDGVVNAFKGLTALNLFYTAAYSRLRILDRINAFSGGNLKSFLGSLNMDEFLQTYTGMAGGMTSIRESLISVMNLVFHDFVSVPFPSTVPLIRNNQNLGDTISSFLFVPDGYSLPPPKCNVIFPNYIRSFSLTDDFRMTPTRFSFRASFPGFATDVGIPTKTYPMQFYPTGFKDYMFGTVTETASELYSLLGTGSILTDSNGDTYLSLSESGGKYGATAKNTVIGGISVSPVMRESDFLSNEESIRGIFLATETFIPGMTTLASHNHAGNVRSFAFAIGTYLFFKKRFAARNAEASLMFDPFLVPGFNAIVVDDSAAGQSVLGKLQQVVHTIRNDSFSTMVQLGYARDFDEVDALTGGSSEPPLPPWFDSNKFGAIENNGKLKNTLGETISSNSQLFNGETQFLIDNNFLGPNAQDQSTAVPELAARNTIASYPVTVFNHMSAFYQALLGCDAVTDIDGQDGANGKLVTSRGAAYFLTEEFKLLTDKPDAKDSWTSSYIYRPVPNMATSMYFLGAVPAGSTDKTTAPIPDQFAKFVAISTGAYAGRFDGTGYPDAKQLAIRRKVIDTYVQLLITQRGFRG